MLSVCLLYSKFNAVCRGLNATQPLGHSDCTSQAYGTAAALCVFASSNSKGSTVEIDSSAERSNSKTQQIALLFCRLKLS